MDPLQKTINFKPKQDAVKQEVDRNEDMIRSALRAIASLNRIRFGSHIDKLGISLCDTEEREIEHIIPRKVNKDPK